MKACLGLGFELNVPKLPDEEALNFSICEVSRVEIMFICPEIKGGW